MAKLSIQAGATSQSVNIFVQNSSSTVGAGLTGFAPAGGSLLSGMTCYYSFSGVNAGSVVQSLSVPAGVTTTFAAGQIVEIDATHMPGVARLDLPNAALAASKGQSVTVYIQGGTNVAPVVLEIELTAWNNQDGVHGGMSALPNTACTTNASLLTSGTGTDQLSVSAGKTLLQATQSGVTIPTVTTVTNQLTAAQVATGVFQDTTAGDFTVSGSIGKSLFTSGNAPGAASGLALVGSNVGAATSVTGNVGGNVVGSVGSISGVTFPTNFSALAIAVTTGYVTVGTNTDKTGYSLTQAFPSHFSSMLISAAGNVGVDWSNVSNQSSAVSLSGTTINLVNTLTTYTNDTPQSGDSYARIGATGSGLTSLASAANLATANTGIAALQTTVGVAGAGLTALASAANLSTANTNISALVTTVGSAGAGLTALASATDLATANTGIGTTNTNLSSLITTVGAAGAGLTALASAANLSTANSNISTTLSGVGSIYTIVSSGVFGNPALLTAIDAIPTNNPTVAGIVAGVFAQMIDGTYDFLQYQRILGADAAGATSGLPTSPTFKRLDGASTVIAGTLDSNGNRTGVTLTP